MAVGVTFLKIVDFDVVNATILIALFRLSNMYASKNVLLYISKEKSFVLYVSRLLKLRECRATVTKNDVNFCTLYKKKIDSGRRLTLPLALQNLFYLVLQTDQ